MKVTLGCRMCLNTTRLASKDMSLWHIVIDDYPNYTAVQCGQTLHGVRMLFAAPTYRLETELAMEMHPTRTEICKKCTEKP